jgi:hypothetical protein
LLQMLLCQLNSGHAVSLKQLHQYALNGKSW